MIHASIFQWIIGFILILTSLGIILSRKPIYSSLSFFLSLLALAVLFLQLSAQFIAVMQILVYAGAILVLFVFVIVLFQDAHQQIERHKGISEKPFLILAACSFILVLALLGFHLMDINVHGEKIPEGYGTVQSLGQALYVDFFFPFEAVILLFLVAVVGALYIGRKEA
jgi:NADH-quinone oxidoreductase subunit J